MAKHRIALLPGDGIGGEVVNEAVRMLKTLTKDAMEKSKIARAAAKDVQERAYSAKDEAAKNGELAAQCSGWPTLAGRWRGC